MTVQTMSPEALLDAFASPAPPLLLDVRTVGEFARGRPAGPAANIPWLFVHPPTSTTPGATVPNTSFLEVICGLYATDQAFVIACEDGTSRSRPAVDALRGAGYTQLAVLDGGYAAWRERKLRSSTDNRPGVSYVSLLMRVKRGAEATTAAGH